MEVATVTVELSDGVGGTVTKTFTLTVNAVNDAPSFTKGANQNIMKMKGHKQSMLGQVECQPDRQMK
jgi:hypothetical protein